MLGKIRPHEGGSTRKRSHRSLASNDSELHIVVSSQFHRASLRRLCHEGQSTARSRQNNVPGTYRKGKIREVFGGANTGQTSAPTSVEARPDGVAPTPFTLRFIDEVSSELSVLVRLVMHWPCLGDVFARWQVPL